MQNYNTGLRSWQFIKEIITSDQALEKEAVVDGKRVWTFREMFAEWERYAAAFSALGITEKNGSRVLLCTMCSSESIMINYGLDMTGAVANFHFPGMLLTVENLCDIVRIERITDIIFQDILVDAKTMDSVETLKRELGLRNIIVYHAAIPKECVERGIMIGNFFAKKQYRNVPGLLHLEQVLSAHGTAPITYAESGGDVLSVLTHTSGTSNGIQKPIPFTDRNRNASALQFIRKFTIDETKGTRCLYYVFPSVAYGLIGTMHLALCMKHALCCGHLNMFSPGAALSIVRYYRPNAIVGNHNFPADIMQGKGSETFDFSNLTFFGVGGSKTSIAKIAEFNDFYRAHGFSGHVWNGYGLSEAGGACCIDEVNDCEGSIGFPMPGVEVLIHDETDDSYRGFADAPVSGELYVSSEAASSGVLDGVTVFETREIGGKRYLRTQDFCTLREDGSVLLKGRIKRGFQTSYQVNVFPEEEEAKLSGCPEIANCVILPEYREELIGNIVKGYIEWTAPVDDEPATIARIMKAIYMTKGMNSFTTTMPREVVTVDAIPLNMSGKTDAHKIETEGLPGRLYALEPVGMNPVTDIRVKAIGMQKKPPEQ